ncbi:hypothetical protein GJ688_05270 [Heliobacillus mobilis]|uniref:DUF1292 domain-containing protein n=1 Tax=Heliobacterium mobile TaxID=28064 RepID=A0A6I3SHZ6_HELMO|nr:hypothetical protein [Heliobacterium mobile]MTV48392.1 hypothetical protein [Heliobacterium mobile]
MELEREQAERLEKEENNRIVVRYLCGGYKRKVIFNGRWLIRDVEGEGDVNTLYSVALTTKEQLFVLIVNRETNEGDYLVFPTFDEMSDSDQVPPNILELVAGELGEECIEFLDI